MECCCFISENILNPITFSGLSHSAVAENGWAWGSLLKVEFSWVQMLILCSLVGLC